jgi:hypothetical protein
MCRANARSKGIVGGMNVYENMTLPQPCQLQHRRGVLRSCEPKRALAREWIESSYRSRRRPNSKDCGGQTVRRQPAEGGAGKMALGRVTRDHPARSPDPRARYRRQGGCLRHDPRHVGRAAVGIILSPTRWKRPSVSPTRSSSSRTAKCRDRFDCASGAKPTLLRPRPLHDLRADP